MGSLEDGPRLLELCELVPREPQLQKNFFGLLTKFGSSPRRRRLAVKMHGGSDHRQREVLEFDLAHVTVAYDLRIFGQLVGPQRRNPLAREVGKDSLPFIERSRREDRFEPHDAI